MMILYGARYCSGVLLCQPVISLSHTLTHQSPLALRHLYTIHTQVGVCDVFGILFRLFSHLKICKACQITYTKDCTKLCKAFTNT